MKVVVPALPDRLVSRPRLLEALEAPGRTVATLVSAPAGSGKTLLLTEWVHRTGGIGTAWVSLDADDNNDHRFWSGVLEAIGGCASVPATNRLRTMKVPARPSRDPDFLAEVIDGLEALPEPIRLVLDDLHELVDSDPLRGIATLLRHRPAGLRLVISTRRDPPLPLARLRMSGELRELRAADLRFSADEAGELLRDAGVAIEPDQVRALVEQTDGWAAGVRLAALSLAQVDDLDSFVAGFAGNDRAVADFLIDEILSRIPAETQDFLRTISVCDQVSATLAGVLSGRDDAGELLDALEHQTSLVISVAAGRRWYKVHALLRAHLLADLGRRGPDLVPVLHRRAADWLDVHGRPATALEHAIAAGDPDHLIPMVRRHGPALVLSGQHGMVQRAITALGEPVLVDDPGLALLAAELFLESGRPGPAEVLLVNAEAAWPSNAAPELVTLRRLMRWSGAEPGEQAVRAMLATARESGYEYLAARCLIMLSGMAAAVGDYPGMTALAREAEALVGVRRWKQTATTAATLLAYGALLRAEPAECLRQTTRASYLIDGGLQPADAGVPLLVGGLTGAALFDTGARAAGLRHLREARLCADPDRLSGQHAALAAMLEHRAASLLGYGDASREVLAWSQQTVPASGELLIMRARARLLFGRRRLARELLRPVLDGSTPTVLAWSLIEAWLLEAQIALAGDDEETQVRRAIGRAVAVAESLDVLYPLVFAPPEVLSRLPRGRFTSSVTATRAALHTRPAPVALTDRERTVLQLLPTVRSLDEIADDLTLSTNTVKTHIRTLYGKLGVGTRRDAVDAARRGGLLEATSPGLESCP
ncbi:MAG TPA: LuxR C-terminal-related transcriptional regulator [Actinophytocola sp.]|uniref:LuxR C-terminal-related transcriptional regulator n=1 Tax=Actinophytocola sp. TaxID=1872138 RepID=UPI002DB650A2|nr:LuxR C-terminal-related transcriptional regulator [Actinophytocola sp.]HEU5472647.1 LuxR C-terminal-related transcriptional regulator [Actinophytocola sp.]